MLISFLAINFCTHDDNIVGPVDTHIDKKGSVDHQDIGVNKKRQLIIQEESDLSSALQTQLWKNEALTDDIKSLYTELEDCYDYLIDPRLGGTSEVFDMPPLDPVIENKRSEEIGYDETGDYKVVQKEYYLDRLKSERSKEKQLQKMFQTLKKTNKRCKAQLVEARIKHGLPSEKYPAVTTKDSSGHLVIIRKAEKNLDDAFEIKRLITAEEE